MRLYWYLIKKYIRWTFEHWVRPSVNTYRHCKQLTNLCTANSWDTESVILLVSSMHDYIRQHIYNYSFTIIENSKKHMIKQNFKSNLYFTFFFFFLYLTGINSVTSCFIRHVFNIFPYRETKLMCCCDKITASEGLFLFV